MPPVFCNGWVQDALSPDGAGQACSAAFPARGWKRTAALRAGQRARAPQTFRTDAAIRYNRFSVSESNRLRVPPETAVMKSPSRGRSSAGLF